MVGFQPDCVPAMVQSVSGAQKEVMKSMKAKKEMKPMKAMKKPSIGPSKQAPATPTMHSAVKNIKGVKMMMRTMKTEPATSHDVNIDAQAVNDPMYGTLVLKSSEGHAQHCLGIVVNVYPSFNISTNRGPSYLVCFEDYENETLHRGGFIVMGSP